MNERQKIVQEAFIDNEEAVIRRLKSVYNQALKNITKKSEELQSSINALTMVTMQGEMDEAAKAQIQSMIQSKVYQKQYQDALKKQVSGILDNMQVEEFKTVSEYLTKCYEEGFLGTMYDLHGQGIPLVFPMDQEAIVRAVQLDSKISNGLYSRLGEDVGVLKKKITSTVSRGISTGMTFQQMAQQLAGYTNIGFNKAVRISRTEGHRIQIQSGMDACYKAKDKGADVLKQWDASLDARTRDSHARVDGEIRELDEPFSNGLMFPGDPSGGASEVVNCRCALLQRARLALDEDELNTLKERAEYYGLDKAENFSDFKKKYLKAAESDIANSSKSSTIKIEDTLIRKSVGAKSKNYDIIDPQTGEYYHFVEGTRIQNSEVFAGYNVKKPLREEVADGLAKEFGGKPEKWQHAKGKGVIDYNGEEIKAEVHWFQEETVGKVKFKVKEWLEDES